MRFFLFAAIIMTLAVDSRANSFSFDDSLRVEARDGKKFIIHKVDAKETLFGISRRYKVTIDQITEVNPGVADGLKIGQELTIPFVETAKTETKKQVKHFVDIGETLYSISKKYDVSVDEIKQWNNLSGNDLDVGQQLSIYSESAKTEETAAPVETKISLPKTPTYHIVAEKETLFAISRLYRATVDDLRKWNSLRGNDISIGQRLIVSDKDGAGTSNPVVNDIPKESETEMVEAKAIVEEPEIIPLKAADVVEFNSQVVKVGSLNKVLEEGMAMVIENSTDTKKYLALHRTASVGTVVRVKNLMNNLTIYVRVVGKLPDTGDNNNLLLKVSRTAYERLGAIDRQFPVEVSYIP